MAQSKKIKTKTTVGCAKAQIARFAVDKRFNVVKENHVCFSCLKRAVIIVNRIEAEECNAINLRMETSVPQPPTFV